MSEFFVRPVDWSAEGQIRFYRQQIADKEQVSLDAVSIRWKGSTLVSTVAKASPDMVATVTFVRADKS